MTDLRRYIIITAVKAVNIANFLNIDRLLCVNVLASKKIRVFRPSLFDFMVAIRVPSAIFRVDLIRCPSSRVNIIFPESRVRMNTRPQICVLFAQNERTAKTLESTRDSVKQIHYFDYASVFVLDPVVDYAEREFL